MTDYFNRGKRDAQHGVHHPPHQRGVLREMILDPYSRRERGNRSDYNDGVRAGRKSRR
jgi:hypothetical protein